MAVLPKSGSRFERVLEPFEGPHVSLARGGGLDAEHGGDLLVAQLLEVAEGEHLAIDRVEAVEGLAELGHRLAALGGLAGRGLVADELGDHLRAGLGREPTRSGTSRAASRMPAPRCWRWTSISRWIVTERSQMKNGTSASAW